MKKPDDLLAEFERRDQALLLQLKALEESGDCTESAKNDVRANVEVAWEAGVFKVD